MPAESDSRPVEPPVPIGAVVAGKYRVERVIGAGGMGVVLAAVHEDLGQPVALKFILQDGLERGATLERFMREARAVARLKSEHVARVFDVGQHEGKPYMVLELLEGLDLAKMNQTRGPLPVADAVEYVMQACEALIEAHAAGIVHRDLKPQNLFVTRRASGAPLVKVLDFGIAKDLGARDLALTDSSAVMGSPLFMAPEQMRSARLADTRSDIWALGVILYEVLGGELPFPGETVTEVCIRVVNETPKALGTLRPGLDTTLVATVMRCLEKDPNARFQAVAQVAAALEPYSRSATQGGPLRPWRSLEDTQDSVGDGKSFPRPTSDGPPGVRTDTSWGRATGPERRGRSWRLALGFSAVGAIAGVTVLAARHRPEPVTAASSRALALPAATALASPSEATPSPPASVPAAVPVAAASPAATVSARPRRAPTPRPRASDPASPATSSPLPSPEPGANGAPILR